MLATVIATEDAADLDRRPDARSVEEYLRHARRPAIHLREVGQARHIELAPGAAGVFRAVERRRPAAGKHDLGMLRMLADGPDLAHRRFEAAPARRAFVPAIEPIVGAGVERVGNARVAAERPDARFEIETAMAVGMHPGLAEIVAEPRGVAGGAGVDADVLPHCPV